MEGCMHVQRSRQHVGSLGYISCKAWNERRNNEHCSRPFTSRCYMTSDFYTVFQEALVGLCKDKNFLAKNEDSCMQRFPLFTDIGKIHSSHSPPYFVSSFSIHMLHVQFSMDPEFQPTWKKACKSDVHESAQQISEGFIVSKANWKV